MIHVAGEALVDLILDPAGALVPRPGGGPFNTARTVARLGQAATFVGRLSGDAFGRRIRRLLEEDGVTIGIPAPTDAPTTLALAELDTSGRATYRFYVAGTSAPELSPADLATAPALGPADALHVGTLGLVLEPMGSALAGLVGAAPVGTLVMVDPNCRPALIDDLAAYRARLAPVLARADVVKVSDEDLAVLAPGVAPDEAARGLVRDGAGVVLLTEGPSEVRAFTRDAVLAVPVPAVEVADTVGAGDAFGGGFLAWWTAGAHGREALADPALLERGIRAAVAVAAVTCERVGASPPDLAELRARRLWPD